MRGTHVARCHIPNLRQSGNAENTTATGAESDAWPGDFQASFQVQPISLRKLDFEIVPRAGEDFEGE